MEDFLKQSNEIWQQIENELLPDNTHDFIASMRHHRQKLNEQFLVWKKYPQRIDEKLLKRAFVGHIKQLNDFLLVIYENCEMPQVFKQKQSLPFILRGLNLEQIEHKPKWFFDYENITDYKQDL